MSDTTSFLKQKFVAYNEIVLRELDRKMNSIWKLASVKYIFFGSVKEI